MLNYIWSAIILISVICAAVFGKTECLSEAIIESGADAIQLLITLAGVMSLWSGILRIAEESGFTSLISRLFSPALGRLFPGLDKNGKAFHAITMNITANLLGMGNTATPFGLKAMKELKNLNHGSDTASDEMIVFVVMNTASLQLIPTTLGALRQSSGSKSPFEIIVPVWICSACALAAGLSIALTGNKRRLRR